MQLLGVPPSGRLTPHVTRLTFRAHPAAVRERMPSTRAGVDASPDWALTHIELLRRGYAYVAASAQATGLDATKAADPERYADLAHPGDSSSYDIYSQAGQAVRDRSGPINTGPATFVLRAAVSALNTWVTTGRPPASAPRWEVLDPNPDRALARFAVDANGTVLGGIRTPAVDAPVALLSGLGQPQDTGSCRLFGTTTPFTADQLNALYRNHGGFVSAWNHSTHAAVQAGFILREDAELLRTVAAQSSIPR